MPGQEEGPPPHFFKGAPVQVRGLQGAAAYNGCRGLVSAGPLENGRYEIALELDNAPDSKVLALKPGNLQLDCERLQEYVTQKRAEKSKRSPALEDRAMLWVRGKGLSFKGLTFRTAEVPEPEEGSVLLRVEKFALSQMALGYLMKGYTRTFSAYHDFYRYPEEGFYRSACWGYCTVEESTHPRVAVGTRLYGLVPACRYQVQGVGGTIPAGRNGGPAKVELTMEGMPFNLRRFQELEVVSAPASPAQAADGDAAILEDWRLVLKEIYTMAFYMDENLLVDTGMINSVIISCASAKTALALAYCLRMREMKYVVGLTSRAHLEFVRGTEFYHEVFTYEDVESLPNNRTIVYMDFRCDGGLRQKITLRMGTNLMYNMVVGPAVFQSRNKDQVFEKRAREVLFDESSWRERRRMVAEVTKTGRNEKLVHSFPTFVERMRRCVRLRRVCGEEALGKTYDAIYSNTSPPDLAYVCTLHADGRDQAAGEDAADEIWGSPAPA